MSAKPGLSRPVATDDPLRPLLDLAGVAAAFESVRDAILAVHKLPVNLRNGAVAAGEASIRAAKASARTVSTARTQGTQGTQGTDSADGAPGRLSSFPSASDSVVADPVLAGSLRIAKATEALLPVWRRAPMQALAKMHVLAAADYRDDDAMLGRPRPGAEIGPRLELLTHLLTGGTSVSGIALAAVVHGELLTLRPFGHANGVVARAAGRLTLIASGVDPKALTVPEVGYLRAGKRYRAAAEEFAAGGAAGLRNWLLFSCDALAVGVREARAIARLIDSGSSTG